MQKEIKKILEQKISKKEKISLISNLIKKEKIKLVVDFDDTISSKSSILHSKYKYLKKVKKRDDKKIWERLKWDFELHPKILEKINWERFLILTRNSQKLLDFFLEEKLFEKFWLKAAGVVGQSKKLNFDSEGKLDFFSEEIRFVWDKFEAKKVRECKNFELVENFNFFTKILLLFKKTFLLIRFIIKNA